VIQTLADDPTVVSKSRPHQLYNSRSGSATHIEEKILRKKKMIMQDVMAKDLALPMKILLTPWVFFLIAIPTLMISGDEAFDNLMDGYWNGW
jgi:hypothetical protein